MTKARSPSSRPEPIYGPGQTLMGEPIIAADEGSYADHHSYAPLPSSHPAVQATRVDPHEPGSFHGSYGAFPAPPSDGGTSGTFGRLSQSAGPFHGPASYGHPVLGAAPYGPPSSYSPFGAPHLPPPPAPARVRREPEGPSLFLIGLVSAIVIGGATTAIFMVRANMARDTDDTPISRGVVTDDPPVTSVPMEDPVPTAAPKRAAAAPRASGAKPPNGRRAVKPPTPRPARTAGPTQPAAPQAPPNAAPYPPATAPPPPPAAPPGPPPNHEPEPGHPPNAAPQPGATNANPAPSPSGRRYRRSHPDYY
jgi:hypothetical protein